MNTLTKLLYTLIVTGMLIYIPGCTSSPTHHKTTSAKTIIVKLHSMVTQLHYKGILHPIETNSVTSPVDGHIKTMNIIYGQSVKKGQLLFILSSKKLETDFESAVTDYFKNKMTYQNGLEDWQGTQMLFKAGVLPHSEFLSSQQTHVTNQLSLFQSKNSLEKILDQVHIPSKAIENMTIANTQKVTQQFKHVFQAINVTANSQGVALYPLPGQDDQNTSSDNSGRLHVGSEVKQDQLILQIGDLSGYSVTFNVSEIEINQLKKGLAVHVTGDAFPNITLAGSIDSVSSQATPDQSGGGSLSQFTVTVMVPHVSLAAKKLIRVGMSCKIDIKIKQAPHIMLPLKAIRVQTGSTAHVMLQTATGKPTTIPVTTGSTTPDGNVVILKGLKVGDKVILHD